MKARFTLPIIVLGCSGLAMGQIKAPPPSAKDVVVPNRTTIPSNTQKADIDAQPLSAKDVVRIALEKQPTLEVVRQAVIAAEGRTKQVRSKLLPQLGIGGSYYSSRFMGDEPKRPQTNVLNGYGATASLTQLIFDANHSKDLVRQSKALKAVAEQDLAKAKEELALQALIGFYLVGEAHEIVSVNEANVANRQSQLELAQSRFNSGLGGPDDVLTAQTAKGNAVIALIQARTNEESARVSLLQTLGLDPQSAIKVGTESAAAIDTTNYENLVTQALEHRPEILRAKANIEAARYGARAAKTSSGPTLSSNLSFSSNDPGFPAGGPAYGVGIILSVPIFDGERAAGAVKEANANLKSAQADLVTTQLQVRTDISQAYLNVRNAEQQYDAAKTNVDNAKESLRIAEGRYKSGVGLFLDIINAQTVLLSAQTSAAVAYSEVSHQRSVLLRATGQLRFDK